METTNLLDDFNTVKPLVKYATFWQRLLALLLDGIIVTALWSLFSKMFLRGFLATNTLSAHQNIDAAFIQQIALDFLYTFAFNMLYFAYYESSEKQATLGKQALGIKVTNLNGERISFSNAVGRDLSKLLSSLTFGIGYLMQPFTEKKTNITRQNRWNFGG